MASRQEEKEARRRERMEQEEAERKAASRNKRLQMLFGGLLAVLVIGGVIAVIAGGGSDDMSGEDTGAKQATSTGAKLPAVATTNEKEAAKAAGCTLANPTDEGRGHEEKTFTASDYKTNPPTSGSHFPSWAQDGIYDAGNLPPLGELVHTLEHGRINIQYKPGTPKKVVDQLEELLAESDAGYHMLLYENPTGMEAEIAATAWDHSLTCPTMNDKVFDALRTFRQAHIDRGPEKVA